jgi:crotonobetaine/carnitine-CoA ligase
MTGIPQDHLAPHALARWAAEAPDRLATVEVDGEALTYAELDARCRRYAAKLRTLGVAEGEHVATLLPNGGHAHAVWIGLAWLRAVEVPLNPALVGTFLHDAVVRSDATALLVHPSLAERLDGLDPLPGVRIVRLTDHHDFLAGVEPATDVEGPVYRDIAALMFTSGTTGPSKPVRVPWANVYQFWSWVPEDTVHAGEALYCPTPVVHNSGRCCLNYCLVQGATFVWREKWSGTTFWDDVRRYGCVASGLVGPMTAFLWAQPPQPDDADNPLRGVIIGPMIPQMEAFKERFGVKVATCYGMTEVGATVTTGWDHGPWQTCGTYRPDYPWPEVRLVDANDEPVPDGTVGEMVVRTAEPWALNAGYHGMPEQTAEAWRNGWFHTGDAFVVGEDGHFTFVDRMKDAIRRRGENISSFEVEAAVRAHPAVADCAAIAVPAELGEDEVMVVVEPNGELDPADLGAWLEPRMPRFMLPRFIDVAVLPRNATTARVKKHELRARGITPTTWDRQRQP